MNPPADDSREAAATGRRGGPGLPMGAVVGSMLGMCGPAIGLFVASAATGSLARLWDEVLLLLLLGAAFGLMLLVILALAQTHGERTGDRLLWRPLFFGSLLIVVGAALLLTACWIEPTIAAEPRLRELAADIGSTGTSDWVSAALIAVGLGMLVRPGWRVVVGK